VPSGAIWPPVEGRAILSELAQTTLVLRRLSNGDWAAGLGSGWRVMSMREAIFATLDQGRAALIQWARLHASANGVISPRRCIVLADDGAGGWRLWQVVRTEDSLRELISRAMQDYTGEPLVSRICQAVQLLLDAQDQLTHLPMILPCNLDTIGSSDIGAIYIGLMPDPATPLTEARPRGDARTVLRGQLEAAIGADLRDRGLDLDAVLARLPGRLPRPDGLPRSVTSLMGA
jgi:hypothetical protein